MAAETQNSEIAAITSTTLPTSSSPATHLPTVTLLSLPPELILDIFEATDSFTTALALSKTCQHLHRIWKVNSDVILPSLVQCFPQAQELARAQEKAAKVSGYLQGIASTRPRDSSFSQKPFTTGQRISKNVDLASCVLKRFGPLQKRARRSGLTPTEQADFLRGLYRALTLAVTTATDRRGIPESLLSPLDMLSYMQMKEAMEVLNFFLNQGSMICQDNTTPLDSAAVVSSVALDLTLFHADLMRLPVNRAVFGYWSRLPWGDFILANGYQAQAGSARGPRLAEIFPLFGDDSFYARQKRSFGM